MGPVVAIARHDLRLVLADRGAVMWMFLLPVVFATFFGLVMSGGSNPADARTTLTVVDADGGPIARMLIGELESEELALSFVDPESKDATLHKVRTLVLPAGLSDAVLAGTPTTVTLEKDPGVWTL